MDNPLAQKSPEHQTSSFPLRRQGEASATAMLERLWTGLAPAGSDQVIFPSRGDNARRGGPRLIAFDLTTNKDSRKFYRLFDGPNAEILIGRLDGLTFVSKDQEPDIEDYPITDGTFHLIAFGPEIGIDQKSIGNTYDFRGAHLFQKAAANLGRQKTPVGQQCSFDMIWNSCGIFQMIRTTNAYNRILVCGDYLASGPTRSAIPPEAPALLLNAIIDSADVVNFLERSRLGVPLHASELFSGWPEREVARTVVEILIDDRGDDWVAWRGWLAFRPSTNFLRNGENA